MPNMKRLHALFSLFESLLRRTPLLSRIFARKPAIAKYLVSGGFSTATQLGLLYLLVDFLALHYLVATSFAFIAALIVSFTLHKFWTFEDDSLHAAHTQFASHAALGLLNLGVNAGLMFLFVEHLFVPLFGPLPASYWIVVAQAMASALIALESFFVYRLFIFGYLRRREGKNTPP